MSKQNSNNLAMPFSNEPLISDIIKVLEKHLNFNKIQDSVNKISQPDIQESEISIETSEVVSDLKSKKGYTKNKKTNLQVEFANGLVIKEDLARDTFVKALHHMGIQKVKRLGIILCGEPLVADFPSKNKRYAAQQPKCDDFFIFTYTSTEKKKKLLENIGEHLGYQLDISII